VAVLRSIVLTGVACALAVTARAAERSGNVARGEYLANHVAMCVECHTPRTASGELDTTRLFAGAPVPVAAPAFAKEWAVRAPSIAGSGGLSTEDKIHLLMTGARVSGRVPLPPMPQFRLTRTDAEAIVAYLRTIKSQP